eukprot:scaffold231092_cov17-Tisochrysis_lutea.AAC.3
MHFWSNLCKVCCMQQHLAPHAQALHCKTDMCLMPDDGGFQCISAAIYASYGTCSSAWPRMRRCSTVRWRQAFDLYIYVGFHEACCVQQRLAAYAQTQTLHNEAGKHLICGSIEDASKVSWVCCMQQRRRAHTQVCSKVGQGAIHAAASVDSCSISWGLLRVAAPGGTCAATHHCQAETSMPCSAI